MNDRTISLTVKKYYEEPVLPNFEDIDTEEDNILGEVTCHY
jgi:hypothetical protein